MSDIFAPADSPSNATEYTVSEISGALRRTVEDAFGNVRVRGEVSGYRGPHSSGHAYFSLKDDRSRLEAVIWKTTFSRLKVRPEEGMEVIAAGKLTTYPGSSKYQIVIESLEPAGAGALMALLEERKRRLQAEGVFDPAYKKPLPYMPRVIGVITSPTGAVIRDILHRLRDRFPLHVIVWPVRVQGDTSGAEVTAAVRGFNEQAFGLPIAKPDVLIVARGGGSLEDLWGFNDEALARTVAASEIPVISAVGHETDWTLVDYAADVRAPTPTAAAEMAVPVKADLEAALATMSARLAGGLSRLVERKHTALRAAARVLPTPDQLLADPRRSLDEASGRLGRALGIATERKRARFAATRLTPQTLERRFLEARRRLGAGQSRLDAGQRAVLRDVRTRFARAAARVSVDPVDRRLARSNERLADVAGRADRAFLVRIERLRQRMGQAERLLASLSHQSVLDRGFVLVRNAGGLVRRAAEVTAGDVLQLQFADGARQAVADGAPHSETPRPRKPPAREPGGSQGSLF